LVQATARLVHRHCRLKEKVALRAFLAIGGRWILRLVGVLLALLVLWTGGSLVAAVVREGGPQPQPPAEGRLVPTDDGAIFAQIRIRRGALKRDGI
jgi:hypothetical protein